jgi:hypothetical protein
MISVFGDPSLSFDSFSAAIRMFSQNLTSLTITACLSPETFWPSPDEPDPDVPMWPNMLSLEVNFSQVAPYGKWYFIDPVPRRNATETSRIYPDAATFDPFLAAFTKAALNMPKVKDFRLLSNIQNDKAPFCISYDGPVQEMYEVVDHKEAGARTIEITYEWEGVWVPEPGTVKMLRTIGQDRYGGLAMAKHVPARVDDADDSTDE